MKKVFLFAVLAIGLYACNGGAGKKEESATEATSGKSIVGKWHAVDMVMKPEAGQKAPTPEEIKAAAAKDSIVFEFMANGDARSTSASHAGGDGKWTKTGNKLEVSLGDGKAETYEISNLTEKSMTLKMLNEKELDDVAIVFEKM